jgi:putative addiction module component (TIGR02574 family)
MHPIDAVFSAAMNLPVDERLRLIDELAASVPDDRPPSLSAEWIAEIDRRSEEIDRGETTLVPWEIVRAEMYRRAGINRAD